MILFVSFLSGMAGLIYEVSWARQVGVLLGHTAETSSSVLCSLFLGMALGYLLGGRIARRRLPFLHYAIVELLLSIFALTLPWLLRQEAATSYIRQVSTSSSLLSAVLLLLPGTVLLGVTLPLLTAMMWSSNPLSRASTLYSVNTFGGLLGLILASFFMIPSFGVEGTSRLAAVISFVISCYSISRHRNSSKIDHDGRRPECKSSPIFSHLALSAVSGAGVLALEAYYIRLLSLVMHNSTFTFSFVVVVTLLSLAIGAWIVSKIKERHTESAILFACAIAAVTMPASVYLFVQLTDFRYFSYGSSFLAYVLGGYLLTGLIAAPSLLSLGTILPLVWTKYRYDSFDNQTSSFALITFVNALGAAGGTALSGALLIPFLGIWLTPILLTVPFVIFLIRKLLQTERLGPAIIFSLLFTGSICLTGMAWKNSIQRQSNDESIVQRWESKYGWIDVVRSSDDSLKVRQNLHYRFGSTGRDAIRAYRQARLPLLLHSKPKQVLFLGLGSGLTAGGAVGFPDIERASVVELIPEVVEAARILSEFNHGVVDHPRFDMKIGDARQFIATTQKSFDLIISDLFVPWESETGYLYTREHYQAAARRLDKKGIFCQWLPLYQLGIEEFESIAESFSSVFPETSLWWGNMDSERPIIALMGSFEKLCIDEASVVRKLGNLYETTEIDRKLRSIQDIELLYVGQWKFQGDRPINTDEHPFVEFSTPVSHLDDRLLKSKRLRSYCSKVLSRLPDQSAGIFLDLTANSPSRIRFQLETLSK